MISSCALFLIPCRFFGIVDSGLTLGCIIGDWLFGADVVFLGLSLPRLGRIISGVGCCI
jgi:hypothetical protein